MIKGYSKRQGADHIAGTERLASAIGNGGLANIGQPIVGSDVLADKRRERDTVLFRVMAPCPMRINRNRLDTLYSLTQPDTTAELTYFFHPDHLGSASWITDLSGQPVQHLQYKPFGGDYIDQQDPNTEYSERFRFTGFTTVYYWDDPFSTNQYTINGFKWSFKPAVIPIPIH